MKYWIGIDPGASGAMCVLNEDNQLFFYDFKSGKIPNYSSLLRTHTTTFPEDPIVMIGLEKVSAMPGQGVKSMFSFGQRLGELEGMLQTLKLGYDMIRPLQWQKACGVKPKSGKQGIYETVSKLYPDASLHGPKGGLIDGRCDALGIAHYIRKTYP